ncbi:MAG: hypothetical protein KDN19_21595, partial [Verrucomicrobiae bacterium]|nr:hypothetical protein [Verrucomicrobiae bacterium]
GIAVANGLSLALGAKVIGLSSLEAMETDADTYAVIGDARRQSFFVAKVEGGRLVGEPELVTEQGLVEHLTLLGREGIPVLTADAALANSHGEVALTMPSAAKLAGRAAKLGQDEIAALESEPLEPHYLRAPYITTPKA